MIFAAEGLRVKGPSKERFETIFTEGRRVSGPLARLISLPGTGLIGVSTAKKIGTRVARNRAARRFREAIRRQAELAAPRLDLVLLVNMRGAEATFSLIEAEVCSLLSRAKERWESELES